MKRCSQLGLLCLLLLEPLQTLLCTYKPVALHMQYAERSPAEHNPSLPQATAAQQHAHLVVHHQQT